jgi:cell division protein FtsI/penicillin-binding protein 2
VLLADWRAERHPLWRIRSKTEGLLKPRDVQSTIISSLQFEAYQKLSDYLTGSQYRNGSRPRKGAILLVDIQTGEYLAKAQFPSPDPNTISYDWSSWDSAVTDTSGFLDSNGNIIDLIENTDRAPGSTAKLNTIMALLSSGQGNKKFWCGPGVKVNGHVINDFNDGSHGWVDASKIIKYSCNRGASQAARAVGPSKLLSLYRSKLRYRLPHMELPEASFRKDYDKIAFGQVISASLTELMTTVCAIARGGEAIELHCIQKHPEDVERWRVCSKDVAAKLSKYMLEVARPGGTAYSVYNGMVAWPSKTGSAEVAGAKKTDAWFVGFAPAGKPKVAFVVWVEEDGTGSNMANQIGLVSLVKDALSAVEASQ